MGMFDTFIFKCPNQGCDATIQQQTKAFGCTLAILKEGSELEDESWNKMDFTGYLRIQDYTEPHTCESCKKNAYAVVLRGTIIRFCDQAEGENFEQMFQGEDE